MQRGLWRFTVLTVLVLLCGCGFFWSVFSGVTDLAPTDVWNTLWNPTEDVAGLIVWNLRLPRTILAALIGINLALSGALLQGVMHNPLADPNIIGVSSGAGLAGIMVMLVCPQYEYLVTPVSFVGALVACLFIYILAWRNGVRPVRVVLAGVAVSAFLGSIITSIMIFHSSQLQGALLWMVGGLEAKGWSQVSLVLPYTFLGLVLVLWAAGYLNILQLGDEMATGLGVNVQLIRILLTAVAALLAASAVSAVGLLGFVGLIVPHIVRLLVGSDYRILLPGTVFLGAALLMFSDTFARTLLSPVELPVGIVMAFLGAPFFLYLLRRE